MTSKHLKEDLSASVVVFLTALPLCLGIALASSAPALSGIIAGIVGGVIVTIFSQSSLGVSGPGAGLAVLVAYSIHTLGSFELFLLATIIAGLLQIVFSLLKAGTLSSYFPSAVIHGMLFGIGVLIIIKQIPHAVGYTIDAQNTFALSQVNGQHKLSELFYMLNIKSIGPLIIFMSSFFILIAWNHPGIKKIPFLKYLQAPLMVVLFGIFLSQQLQGLSGFSLADNQLVTIANSNSYQTIFSYFNIFEVTHLLNPKLYTVAITLAIVASLETLLCLEATDKLDPKRRHSPPNKELFAQGMGNMVSGIFGGLPVTQVIIRSSANIQAGAQTKLSSFCHGMLLFICILFIPNILALIPLASLAAILLMVGYKLANPNIAKNMYKRGWSQFLPFVLTVLGILFTDLLTGIALGLVVALCEIIWETHKHSFFSYPEEKELANDFVNIELSENVSFINKASLQRFLDRVPKSKKIVINANRSQYIHPDVLDMIEEFISTKEKNQIKLIGFKKKYLIKG